jgi:hypothetical protein
MMVPMEKDQGLPSEYDEQCVQRFRRFRDHEQPSPGERRSTMCERPAGFNRSPEAGHAFHVTRIADRINEAVPTENMHHFGYRSACAPQTEQGEAHIPEYQRCSEFVFLLGSFHPALTDMDRHHVDHNVGKARPPPVEHQSFDPQAHLWVEQRQFKVENPSMGDTIGISDRRMYLHRTVVNRALFMRDVKTLVFTFLPPLVGTNEKQCCCDARKINMWLTTSNNLLSTTET